MKIIWFSHISTIHKISPLILFALVVFTVNSRHLIAQDENQRESTTASERRALDLLDTEERAYAERIARTDKRVQELLGEEGVRVVSIEPILLKPKSPKEINPSPKSQKPSPQKKKPSPKSQKPSPKKKRPSPNLQKPSPKKI